MQNLKNKLNHMHIVPEGNLDCPLARCARVTNAVSLVSLRMFGVECLEGHSRVFGSALTPTMAIRALKEKSNDLLGNVTLFGVSKEVLQKDGNFTCRS